MRRLLLWDALRDAWSMARGRYKYSPLPDRSAVAEARENITFWAQNHRKVLNVTMASMAALVFWYLAAATV